MGAQQFGGHTPDTISSVLVVAGTDEDRLRKIVEDLKEKVLGGGGGFNELERWDAAEQDAGEILSSAEQIVFGGGRKLLLVRNAGVLLKEKAWQNYFENPAPGSVVVLAMDKWDARKKLPKACEIIHIAPQRGEWRGVLSEFPNLQIGAEAVKLLREWIGEDAGAMRRELEKISVACAGKARVETADIEELVFRRRQENIFALADAIFSGDRAKAVRGMRRWRDAGHSLFEILGMLRSQAEKLYLAGDMMRAGKRSEEICRGLRVPPFFSDAFLRKAKRMRQVPPARFFARLQEAERDVKSGRLSETASAELLSLEI